MRYIALGVLIIAAFFVPALLAAAQAIYRAAAESRGRAKAQRLP